MATTTMHGHGQKQSGGVTRRNLLRWAGRVAATGALAAIGADGLSGSAHARHRGKQRRRRRNHQPQVASTQAIAAPGTPDEAVDDLAFAVGRCRTRLVCTPSGWCTHRAVCR